MNPFVLLVKPLIAVGVLVTKMAVAVGYVVTEGGQPTPAQQDYMSQVRFTVTPSETGVGTMEIELPNGELFELTSIEEVANAGSSSGPTRPGHRPQQRTSDRPDLIASLESTLGRAMRCNVDLGDESSKGSADCKVEAGETYKFEF